MEMLRIVASSDRKALAELRERLSVEGGLVTPSSAALTKKVFGRPLPPKVVVAEICDAVRRRGDRAVAEYTRKFDGADVAPSRFRVREVELERAWKGADPRLRKAIAAAGRNILSYQKAVLQEGGRRVRTAAGAEISLKVMPLDRVGVYVPGGTAPLFSSVLMNVLPAVAAGVKEIAVCSPPRGGKVHPAVLAACRFCGVKEVYGIGGVQALAAMAYGTETVRRVDKIVGPGNLFVALAKKHLFGTVDIDLIAGPSEVAVVADASARPEFVALDLLAQAEHYPGAAVLFTDSRELAERVVEETERLLGTLSRAEMLETALRDYSLIVVCRSVEEACRMADELAPEHLSVCVKDPAAALRWLRHAGAVFVGPWTAVAFGDYWLGPSHTLPTGGTARFVSGLNANHFVRTVAVMKVDRAYVERHGAMVELMAETEGLTAHAESVRVRRMFRAGR